MQDKSGIFHEIERYLQNWHCDDSTILKCYRTLTNDLIENGLIIEESRQITGKIYQVQHSAIDENENNLFYQSLEYYINDLLQINGLRT